MALTDRKDAAFWEAAGLEAAGEVEGEVPDAAGAVVDAVVDAAAAVFEGTEAPELVLNARGVLVRVIPLKDVSTSKGIYKAFTHDSQTNALRILEGCLKVVTLTALEHTSFGAI